MGKIGLFADQDTNVHFTKINISNIIHTENKIYNFNLKQTYKWNQ